MPASPPTRSPAVAPSGCSPGRMPVGAAALTLLCNLIYSLQSLLSQFKNYYPGFWITKQIVINRVRRLVKNCIYPVVFIIYIMLCQISPHYFCSSLLVPLNVSFIHIPHTKNCLHMPHIYVEIHSLRQPSNKAAVCI